MATPAKSVQARDIPTLVKIYKNMGIPTWSVKQGSALCYKYIGEDIEEGGRQLEAYLDLLQDTESAAIYQLCLYEDFSGRLTDKTECDLSNNFRLNDNTASYGSPDHFGGGYGAILGEIKTMRKELNDLKNQQPEENKLGIIGEILEYESLQPIIMAIGNKCADWIMSPAKQVGELKRVSGVPPGATQAKTCNWREDKQIGEAMDVLALTGDLPEILAQLALLSRKKPTQFVFYKNYLLKMKL